MEQHELETLANQLACPHGEQGAELGIKMNALNTFITQTSITELAPSANEHIVEIGFGNGELSLPVIDLIGAQGHFTGIETSSILAKQAADKFQDAGITNISILQQNCHSANISASSQDGIFAVNVLYFIFDLQRFFTLLHRWLKPEGRIVMGIRSKETLQKMPFTQYGFNLRSQEEYLDAMRNSGLTEVKSSYYDEGLIQFGDLELPMDTLILSARKESI
ncbi:hypothetical protein MNBD_GAMMA12-2488 [hydrothermal vent metagenome]|uniref:Methyltransferase domain-containing protein n=1 Tax=hydrothermal vent metagenome TaxID=652676 RepID=A0A3B0YXX5_9ZZZZ